MESHLTNLIIIFGIAFEVFFWLPSVVAAYMVVKRGKGVKGRWLFVVVAPAIVLTVTFGVPIHLFAIFASLSIFVVPVFVQVTKHFPWWLGLAEGFAKYWWMGFIPAMLTSSIAGTFFVQALWKRWPKLFDAIVSNPNEK